MCQPLHNGRASLRDGAAFGWLEQEGNGCALFHQRQWQTVLLLSISLPHQPSRHMGAGNVRYNRNGTKSVVSHYVRGRSE